MNWLSLLTVLACALALPANAQTGLPRQVLATKPIEIGTSYQLRSAVLGDEREINIWTPPDYGTSQRCFDVVVLLDGALDQDFVHIAGLAQLGALSWTYGPFIVVGVQTKARRAELTPAARDPRYLQAFPESGKADRFRQFLRQEILPFVTGRYRTTGRAALMGESLAGLFVVDSFLNAPELFTDYIAISPSLWWDDRALARRAGELLRRPRLADRRLYLTIADEGGTMQDGVDQLTAALRESSGPSGAWLYSDQRATRTHATIYHSAAEAAFRWLYPVTQPPAERSPWFMIDGAAPPPKSAGED